MFKKLFKASVPNIQKYVGKTIKIDGQKVKIKTICGNRFKQNFYEINGEHLMSMLRFHAQMEGDNSITEDQFLAFEAMEMSAEKIKDRTVPIEVKSEVINGEKTIH